MKILVTGAHGLLGHEFIELISSSSSGHHVHAVVRDLPEERVASVQYHALDLSENFECKKLPTDIDVVYHLAQSSLFRGFPGTALDIFNVNIHSTALLLDYAYKTGVKRFVYASSGGVYGSGGLAFDENAVINPKQDLGYYLGSKLCSEILCQNYSSHMDVTILRFFFLYGARQKRSMLLPRLVDSVRDGKTVYLQGDEGISINPIHVKDAVKCLEKILLSKGSQTINIAGDRTYSLKSICSIIAGHTGVEPVYEYSDQAPQDLLADISLLKEKLYEPQILLEDGIKDLL